MTTLVLSDKLQHETITVKMDFTSRMEPGETVNTAIAQAVVSSGVDPSPADIISGIATVTNNIVSQVITGGLPGVIYKLSFSVRSSANNILINTAQLAVLSSADPGL
jgi:hypothetical protein